MKCTGDCCKHEAEATVVEKLPTDYKGIDIPNKPEEFISGIKNFTEDDDKREFARLSFKKLGAKLTRNKEFQDWFLANESILFKIT